MSATSLQSAKKIMNTFLPSFFIAQIESFRVKIFLHLKNWSGATPAIKIVSILLICHCLSFDHCMGQRALTLYPDSVIYLFNTDVIPRADKEYMRPLLFRIKLPPGVLSTYKSGFSAFGFQYSEKQAVYVYLDKYSTNVKDTFYCIKDEVQIERLLLDDLNAVNSPDKLNIDNNPF